jgi:hypothetical protein
MPILQGRASYAGGFVVRGFEYNDDFTRANVEAAIQEFHLKLLRFVPSAFPEVPVSTLHTYHSPAIVYLFVPPTGS